MESVQSWYDFQESSQRKVSLLGSYEWRTTHASSFWWKILRICSSWHWSSQTLQNFTFQIFFHFSILLSSVGQTLAISVKSTQRKESIMKQSMRKPMSSFHATNTILTTRLHLSIATDTCMQKIPQIFRYNPAKCFYRFIQSVVSARQKGEEKPNSNVVGDTMKHLADSFCDDQITHHNWDTVTKCFNVKNHSAINFKKIGATASFYWSFVRSWACSAKNWTSGTNNCLISLSFWKTVNFECWNLFALFPKGFVTPTVLRYLKSIRTPSIWFCQKKCRRLFSSGRKGRKESTTA